MRSEPFATQLVTVSKVFTATAPFGFAVLAQLYFQRIGIFVQFAFHMIIGRRWKPGGNVRAKIRRKEACPCNRQGNSSDFHKGYLLVTTVYITSIYYVCSRRCNQAQWPLYTQK